MQSPSLVSTPFGRLYSQRNSEGKLIAEFRPGSMSTTTRFSVDRDDFYFRRLSKYENRSTSVFSTVYASYIFLFISVLFSVTIVVAVGFLLHSYSPRAPNSMHAHARMHEKSSEPATRTTSSTVQDHVGATPDKARIHWKKTAIRTLGIPRLPLIVEEEHRRHTAARIEEEERKARHEYEKVLLQLPRVNASYADSTDYFSEFLQGDKIRDAETAELEQFLRQIDLLIADTKSYEAASELADKLLSHGSETEASDSAAVSQTIFDELVKNFAEKSFALCSLKSQELHVRATRYADMR
ncbi:hypothetical protein AAVH_02069 [Aphelenchoides avenae]|nr:hypothetical protein AAVH_02069 [Aphelenchus avenae]